MAGGSVMSSFDGNNVEDESGRRQLKSDVERVSLREF